MSDKELRKRIGAYLGMSGIYASPHSDGGDFSGVTQELSEGSGFWRTCTGCCELEDGQNVHGYPHSPIFKCTMGSGCSECGGLGAVWDTTNYGAMADELNAEMYAPNPQPVAWDHVSDIHRIIRDHLPTSSELADARMYDAARAIAALATPPRPALSREEIARIIDPWPFDFFEMSDVMNTSGGSKANARKAEALRKAAAILSAQSQATVTNGSGTANEGG